MPLKHNTIISSNNDNNNENNKYKHFKSYYPSFYQRTNEIVHDLNRRDEDSETKSEIMESSESNYYSPSYGTHHQQPTEQQSRPQQRRRNTEEDEYSDYTSDLNEMPPEMFESAKIKPISVDISSKKFSNISNEMTILDTKTNITKPQQEVPIDVDTENSTSKFSKLLFSSPSATVTSNGPSVSCRG